MHQRPDCLVIHRDDLRELLVHLRAHLLHRGLLRVVAGPRDVLMHHPATRTYARLNSRLHARK